MVKAILKTGSPDLIRTVCEIIYNILRGNVNIDSKTKRTLRKYKKELRCLICPKRALSSKRKLLIQKGNGFISAAIGSVLASGLASLVGKYLNKDK